jgi:hypothetical protein
MLHFKHPAEVLFSFNVVNATFILLIAGFVIVLYFQNTTRLQTYFSTLKKVPFWIVIGTGVMLGVSLIALNVNTHSEFLYFNF